VTKARDVATQGGLVLISSTTFSAQSSVSFDNVFSSAYDNYKILINWENSGNSYGRLRFRVDGADNTTANYHWFAMATGSGSTAYDAERATAATSILCGYSYTSTSSTEFTVFSPFLSKVTQLVGQNTNKQAANAGTYSPIGHLNVTTSYTGFTFLPDAGTVTGTIKVYGIRN
jgi:hypothetical protein